MAKFRGPNGKPLNPIIPQTIHQIPPQRTIIYTFPAFDQNENIITEITNVIQGMLKYAGVERKEIQDNIIMHTGDRLTVRNIRYIYIFHL